MAERTSTMVTGISCDKPRCPTVANFGVHVDGTHLPTDHIVTRDLIRLGWSLWVGGRGRRTYCPEHGPTVSMRRIW